MQELDYKILESGGSVYHGSTILKSMQNNSTPLIDLLVREAIQNSNDAAIDINKEYYSVSFTTGKFDDSAFNSLFPENIRNELNSRAMCDDSNSSVLHNDFIEIRDTKTCGLSGGVTAKVKAKEKHGHFAKLIYDCGIEQEEETSGGSWGFGKSVYYRTSDVGIVIFYSRTKVNDKLESRLIVTLVENQKDVQSVLDKQNEYSAGKAWFGDKDPTPGRDEVLPIVDETRIAQILSMFKLPAFGEDITGTAVIIPYINKDKLLNTILPEDGEEADEEGTTVRLIDDDSRASYTWARDFEEYLRLCIQKWYAPKLQNIDLCLLGTKFLKAYVNGNLLRNDDLSSDYRFRMHPFFKAVQDLYTAAYAASRKKDFKPKKTSFCGIETKPVVVRNYCNDGEVIGHVAILKIKKEAIDQGGTNPYAFLRKFSPAERKKSVVLMYAREPGMIIDYVTSGDWISGISNEDADDHYLLAFFVPDTEKRMKNSANISSQFHGKRLGKYLKACEASDHMEWKDRDNMFLVERLKDNTRKVIKNVVTPQVTTTGVDETCKLAVGLGRVFSKHFIQGGRSRGNNSTDSSGRGKQHKDFVFMITSTRFLSEGEMAVAFETSIPNGLKSFIISICVEAGDKWLSPESWEKNVGITYPLAFSKNQTGDCDGNFSLVRVTDTKVQVTTTVFDEPLKGEVIMSAIDRTYHFKLVTSKEKGDKNDGK